MADSPLLSTSTEDYLEAIFRLIVEKGVARVRDIAAALSVHKSTVSSALKALSEKGLVNYSPYEITTLTPRGQEIAQNVSGRHEVIRRFLAEVLAVTGEAAETNACRMEHILDAEVLNRLSQLVDFANESHEKGSSWVQDFQHYSKQRSKRRNHRMDSDRPIEVPGKKSHQRTPERGNEETMLTLDQLKPGQKAHITRVGSTGPVRRRIADMGVVRGTVIEVVRIAPLGDPIEVKVKGYSLSLRKGEAATIAVELS